MVNSENYKKIYYECETYFDRNYSNVSLHEKNWYLKGVIDAIDRVKK